jgi:hypothetical protein
MDGKVPRSPEIDFMSTNKGNKAKAFEIRLPDPTLPPSAKELEQRRTATQEIVESDPLPATLKEALVFAKTINQLPEKDPTKAARLRRIGLHIERLSAGPIAPWAPFPVPGGRPVSDAELQRVRESLLRKK